MIRSYKEGDEQKIEALFEEVFQKQRSPKEWQWKFIENPTNQQLITVFEENEEVVGHVSVLPHKAKWFDEEITFGARSDTMVSGRHRGKKIYQKITEQLLDDCRQQSVGYLYGFPAPDAKRLFIRYTNADEITYVPRIVLFRKPASILTKKLPILKLAKPLVAVGEMIYNKGWKLDVQTAANFQKITHCDAKFDELWETAKTLSPIMIKRDAAFLNWRYHEHPEKNYDMYGYYENNELKGYVVTSKDEKSMGRNQTLTLGTIVDIFAVDNEKIWNALVTKAVMTLDDAEVIQTWALKHTKLFKLLRQKRFFHKDSPMPLVGKVVDKRLLNNKAAADSENWFITPGDVDSF